jgi:nucleoside-diphosphate-sugar epimerase
MKILITGGNGNIAKMIKSHLSNEFSITSITRNDFDMLDCKSVENYLLNNTFDVLIHTAIKGGRRTKEENGDVVHQNLLMFENIIKFADKFKLILNFDSGAIYDRSTDILLRKEDELFTIPTDYYGFSKYLIYKRTLQYKNIINLRIFNIFHGQEEPDRFIKACFIAEKNKTEVNIFEDKYFDFVYENDFIKIIRYCINHHDTFENMDKTFNISYNTKYKLSDIAKLIVNDHNKIIVKKTENCNSYCGDNTALQNMNIEFDGLEQSLQLYADVFHIMG